MREITNEHAICQEMVTSLQGTIKMMDNRDIDYDEWGYFYDHASGIGIVINHFRDGSDPSLNVYIVPKDKAPNNDWHSDMEDITDSVGKAYKTWYEVSASSPTQGSATIESFDYLEDAKKFATHLCNSKDMLPELANDIESVFITRWTWDGENNNELDQTFTQLKYHIETYEKAKEVNDEQG